MAAAAMKMAASENGGSESKQQKAAIAKEYQWRENISVSMK